MWNKHWKPVPLKWKNENHTCLNIQCLFILSFSLATGKSCAIQQNLWKHLKTKFLNKRKPRTPHWYDATIVFYNEIFIYSTIWIMFRLYVHQRYVHVLLFHTYVTIQQLISHSQLLSLPSNNLLRMLERCLKIEFSLMKLLNCIVYREMK